MIKRPLHRRFGTAVPEEVKTTTIRDKPWPVGVPIMLYHWSGAPYRSKHVDVAVIVVEEVMPIGIERLDDKVWFFPGRAIGAPLWQVEGFESEAEMQDWFLAKMKPGEHAMKHLMRFRLWATEEREESPVVRVEEGSLPAGACGGPEVWNVVAWGDARECRSVDAVMEEVREAVELGCRTVSIQRQGSPRNES